MNSRFKENAMRLSRIAKDQLVPAMDTAVWWVEYVIRHNGARHLRMASFDLKWFQLALLDVYGFLLFIAVIFIYVLYFTIRTLVTKLKSKSVNGKNKVKLSKKIK